jgi:site-specific DNA-methyltransferase (adenine-specific)
MPRFEMLSGGNVALYVGDCREMLRHIPDGSVDAVVTDPPYGLTQNKKGGSGVASVNLNSPYGRARIGTGVGAGGFMGQKWDTGETAFAAEFWSEVLRVLKPGGHVAAFGGTRTYHRLACAIEDAGFEIRDQLAWAYGSGFPKSLSLRDIGRPELGTALKPAWEPICLARKPLIGTVAANVMEHGTGALNIDGCRVPVDPEADASQLRTMSRGVRERDTSGQTWGLSKSSGDTPQVVRPDGRFPANLIHDGSDEVVGMFPETGVSSGGQASLGAFRNGKVYGAGRDEREKADPGFGGAGSAARFFYAAKASARDRLGSAHPTVKPISLMRWLARLITPEGGVVLDPFAGTGTLGEAAVLEGLNAVLIEREETYSEDIRFRMSTVGMPGAERIAAARERGQDVKADADEHG